MEFSAEMIAGFLGGEVVGDPKATVSTLAKIEEGTPGALSFLSNPKYEHYIYDSDSSIVIVNNDFKPSGPVKATMVRVEDAYSSFAKLLELYIANRPQKKGISAKMSLGEGSAYGENCYIGDYAVIADNVKIGKNCKIYPHVFIDDNVTIGDNVTLHSGVKIYEQCRLGNNIIVHSGAVIGIVIIEDNVELGANTCIDRATMGATVIKRGVKLDNLIQIAHNVVIGENTVAAAQLGVAGSTKVGANVMMGGQVGIIGHLNIGNGVHIASKSGITNNINDGESFMGFPSLPAIRYQRSFAIFKNLPDLAASVYRLEKQMKKLNPEEEK